MYGLATLDTKLICGANDLSKFTWLLGLLWLPLLPPVLVFLLILRLIFSVLSVRHEYIYIFICLGV